MERFNWTLYPEARQKLKESGLMEMIKEADRDYKIGLLGFLSEREIFDCIKGMNEERLFETIPIEERKKFKKALSDAWSSRQNFYWSIKRNGEDSKENMKPEDLLLLSGFRAAEVMRNEELFDYKKFGFQSISELAGTTGAAIEITVRKSMAERGFKWETKRADGRVISTTITGDGNADFRIYQNDITAYETVDPLGNKVHYRPETNSDQMTVAAYHSTEGATLVSLLKYVNQIDLKPETLENSATDTINWAKSLERGGGSCAEHFGGFDESALLFFSGWPIPIPQLDENYQTKDRCVYRIGTFSEGTYNFYVGPEKELIIAYDHKSMKGNINLNGSVTFLPWDVDNVIKGLLYQAAKGLGRTSLSQLIDIIKYRFSPDFGNDMAAFP